MIIEFLVANAGSLFIGSVIFVLVYLVRKSRKYSDFPPGPRPWPIVGNALLLSQDACRAVRKLRAEYGDVFTFYMGSQPSIMITGYDAMKEVFSDMASVGRGAYDFFDTSVPGLKGHGFFYGGSVDTWKTNRRLTLSMLRDFGMGKNKLQQKIHKEITYLTDEIKKTNGDPFDIRILITNAVSNIISSIIFGKRFEYNDEEFDELSRLLKRGFAASKPSFELMDRSNWLINKVTAITGTVAAVRDTTSDIALFADRIITRQEKSFDPNNIRCLSDAFYKNLKESGSDGLPENYRPEQETRRIATDLFAAGTETTSTTINWAIMYYINYPELQTEIHKEIMGIVGSDRLPQTDDRLKLPKLDSAILEVLRHAGVVPFAVPHVTTAPMVIRGHDIPTGTTLFSILDAVLKDEHIWNDPFTFKPDRFIENGSVKTPEQFIPFGIGKRICVGEMLARMELFLFIAALTQAFEFFPEHAERPPPIKGALGITHEPVPFLVRAVPRQKIYTKKE